MNEPLARLSPECAVNWTVSPWGGNGHWVDWPSLLEWGTQSDSKLGASREYSLQEEHHTKWEEGLPFALQLALSEFRDS